MQYSQIWEGSQEIEIRRSLDGSIGSTRPFFDFIFKKGYIPLRKFNEI